MIATSKKIKNAVVMCKMYFVVVQLLAKHFSAALPWKQFVNKWLATYLQVEPHVIVKYLLITAIYVYM